MIRTVADYTIAKKKTKGQALIYKTLHRKLKIDKHESYKRIISL